MASIKGLETPEVVEALLSYVPPEDLKTARAVAKLWRDESLDNFRKSLVYVLGPKTESERLLKLTLGIGAEANEGGQNVEPLLPPMYRFQDKPFKKYRLMTSQEFPPTNMESYEQKRYFWELCGPNVTYLDLKRKSNFSKSFYIDGLIWLFKTCPNLEELSFFPVWNTEEDMETNENDYYDYFADELGLGLGHTFDQRAKRLGILRKLPVSKNDLAKMLENPAFKMKAISIPFWISTMNRSGGFEYFQSLADQDYMNRSRTFWWCIFSLLPNLKKLEIERLYVDVMEALLAGSLTTGQLIQLETFIFNGSKNFYSTVQFRLEPLLKYLEQLEQVGGFLKNLTINMIACYHFWEHPRTFRNVVFRIRKRIEKFHFGFMYLSLTGQEARQCKFDLFNFIFPNLTDFSLEFDFDAKQIFLFFDFSVFRGTPNLTRFRMKYSNVGVNWVCLRKPLATAYLKNGGPGEKWHALEAVRANEAKEGVEILQGDGDETFDPAGKRGVKWEDDIVLEKMKEFYYTGRFTTKAILVFGKWMKNLKEFGIIFDDETIFIPFVVWPGTLKKLTVLALSFAGEGKVSEKSISELKEMYPEVEIVVEDYY